MVFSQAIGVDHAITIDIHAGQIQGFFPPSVPMDNISATVVVREPCCSMHNRIFLGDRFMFSEFLVLQKTFQTPSPQQGKLLNVFDVNIFLLHDVCQFGTNLAMKNVPAATHKGFLDSVNDVGRKWLGKNAPAATHKGMIRS